ncbi:MAG: thioredoxin TrxC [Gammaproteobacteria bacterium]|nr:thioredoxin TrxC [Gammaproteobacteria bacterium]
MSMKKHIVCPSCVATNAVPEEKLSSDPKCGKCKEALFKGVPQEATSVSFNKIISKNEIPVIVDFWAPWCGPCKMMAPNFAQAAQQIEPKARLVKVNTEAEQQLGAQMRIQSIPTLAVFKNGKEVARQAGAMGAADLVRWIEQYL